MNDQRESLRNQYLFQKLDQYLKTDHRFTCADLGREDLCRYLCIDRNRFGTMIKQQAHVANLRQYLNELRLEYAVRQMREHPNWSILAIADSCGMSITPFKRAFKEKYGMPPSKYRTTFIDGESSSQSK